MSMNNIVIEDNLNNSDNSNCDTHFVDSKLTTSINNCITSITLILIIFDPQIYMKLNLTHTFMMAKH